MAAEREQSVPDAVRERHHLGAHGNPIYREVFRRPATGAGGAILAAHLTRDGGQVHVPGAGTHHAMPDRASGFCYLNDVALGLLTWLDLGLSRVVYVDLDAHHGDGVEAAFAGDARVLTISVHEVGRWPRTGADPRDHGPLGNRRNLPVPESFNDNELTHVLHRAVLPLVERVRPEALMVQCGSDALEDDPLSRLSLSNNALFDAVRVLSQVTSRFIVTGGGGYNPWSVARCWAGVWGTLDGREVPFALPEPARAVLRAITWPLRAAGRNPPARWWETLRDPPNPGPVRPEVVEVCEAALG